MPDTECPHCVYDDSEWYEVGVINYLCTHDESNKRFCDGCVKAVANDPIPF